MFTGIIEGTGRVERLTRTAGGATLAIRTALDFSTVRIGDSIAVDGCCLTATECGPDRFVAMLSAETLARTTAGELAAGRRVNLERSLRVGDRMDGHIVQGHVDGVGRVRRIVSLGEAKRWELDCSAELAVFLVEKGSIAIDGISLTVNGVDEGGFHVAIIPHTAEVTALGDKHAGSTVNLETDVIGKYVVALARRAGLVETADARLLRKLGAL